MDQYCLLVCFICESLNVLNLQCKHTFHNRSQYCLVLATVKPDNVTHNYLYVICVDETYFAV